MSTEFTLLEDEKRIKGKKKDCLYRIEYLKDSQMGKFMSFIIS